MVLMKLYVLRKGFPSYRQIAHYKNISQEKLDELLDTFWTDDAELSSDDDKEWIVILPA